MFSKHFLWLILVAVVGCSIRFDKPAPPPPDPKVNQKATQCLSNLAEVIQSYFQAEAGEEQVEAFWECALNSLEFFTRYVQGSGQDHYAPTDLRAFLHRHFLGNLRITDGMLAQAMRFKQMLFGRSDTQLTREDLRDIRGFLGLLKQISLDLRPHIRIYTSPKRKELINRNELEAAALALENAGNKLAPVMLRSRTNYRLEDLMQLINELQGIFNQTTKWEGPRFLGNHMALFNALRTLYTGGNPEYMKPNEWSGTLNAASRIFFEWLRFKSVLKQDCWRYGEGLDQFSHFTFEIVQLLEEGISNHPEKEISYEKFGQVFDLLAEAKWLPFELTAATYKSLLVPIFSKMLKPLEDPKARVSRNAMTFDVVRQAGRELRGWYIAQRWAAQLTPPPLDRGVEITDFDSRPRSWSTYAKHFHKPFVPDQVQSIFEMKRLMYGPVHVLFSDKGSIRMGREAKFAPYDLNSLSQLNWRRLMMRLAIRGYAEQRDRGLNLEGLTADEFREFYRDIRPLGVAVHVLDPREEPDESKQMWQTLFNEANWFTFRGNGDNYLDFAEGVELLALGASTGAINKKLRSQVTEDLLLRQKSLSTEDLIGDEDVFGFKVLDAKEFRRSYKRRFVETYSHLPTIMKEYHRLRELSETGDPLALEKFFASLERASRRYPEQKVNSVDIDHLTMILHYIEALYDRYDLDDSGGLSADEILAAMPRFRELLERLSCHKIEYKLEAILTYMAKEGREIHRGTGLDSIVDMFNVSIWAVWGRWRGWKIDVRPSQMLGIFGDILNNASSSKPCK